MFIESAMPSNYLILCHPFSSCLQSFPESGSFQMSQFFASGGQSIGALASASVLPVNIQGWFPLGLTDLLSLLFRDVQESSPAPQFKSLSCLVLSLLHGPTITSTHYYWKNHCLNYSNHLNHCFSHCSNCLQIFVGKVKSLRFNMLPRFVNIFINICIYVYI